MPSGVGPGLSRRIFSDPLQDLYHCQRSAGHGPRSLSTCFSRKSVGPLLFSGGIGSKIWRTNEGKNRQALQPTCLGIRIAVGGRIPCPKVFTLK